MVLQQKQRRPKVDINAIVLELMSRIKVLEEKVKALEEKCDLHKTDKPSFPFDKISDKYRPLAEHLYEKWEKRITLSYGEIEAILGFKLPPTAYKIPRSYWANTLTHTYATSWLSVGYKAKVDVDTFTVTFDRNLY